MPSKINFAPAGCEFSGSDDEDHDYSPKNVKKVEKTPIQLKKERLLEAIKQNDLALLREEMKSEPKGFDIDESLDGRWNCLYHACFLALPEIVAYLLEERGSYANLEDGNETPLIIACSSEADSDQVFKVVKSLVNKSGNFRISNACGVTPILQACLRGHLEVVKYLLGAGETFDTVDNEGKNMLFYAIDGKQLEVATFLIDSGINLDHTNTYRVTAKEHAVNENQLDILMLFPQEIPVYQPPVNFLSYSRFEELIPSLDNEVPAYFPDVSTMLQGMKCEQYIPNFAKARIPLEEFLTIDDKRLKEIGVELPFHRKLIQDGLQEFVLSEWHPESLYAPFKVPREELSFYDVSMICVNVHRQLVVIRAHLHWLQRLGKQQDMLKAYEHHKARNHELFKKFGDRLKAFEALVKKKYCSHQPTRPLLISKLKKSENWSVIKIASLVAVPIIAFAAFKMFSKSH